MLSIESYDWDEAPEAVRAIRQAVFIDEQRVPPELEWDATDEVSRHFLVRDEKHAPLATARLYPTGTGDGAIGRMAVVKAARGRGVGRALLRHIMQKAAAEYDHVVLSAQVEAIPFYQRLGFFVCSEEYDDAGIPHRDMRCTAPYLFASQTPETTAVATLEADTTSWQLTSESDWNGCLDAMTTQATRRLWIYETTLDHARYNRLYLRDALSRLARHSRHTEIRLLIHEDRPMMERRHQLVQLIRRLPTHIRIKLVNPNHPFEDSAFVLADDTGVIFRRFAPKPDGFANFAAGRRVKPLEEVFQRMWDYARPSLEVRELGGL
ncbi:GNAT family N-acetyltransferase [Marinobacteraceae bacterium S3BR75-40.1]